MFRIIRFFFLIFVKFRIIQNLNDIRTSLTDRGHEQRAAGGVARGVEGVRQRPAAAHVALRRRRHHRQVLLQPQPHRLRELARQLRACVRGVRRQSTRDNTRSHPVSTANTYVLDEVGTLSVKEQLHFGRVADALVDGLSQ